MNKEIHEIHMRLNRGQICVAEADRLVLEQLTEAQAKINKLEAENENLKCCGNCKYAILSHSCITCKNKDHSWFNEKCKGWVFDNLTKQQREV